MPGFKYALMVCPISDDREALFELGPGLTTWIDSVPNLIAGDHLERWQRQCRDQFASTVWNEVNGRRRVVLTTMPSDRPRDHDHETVSLEDRLWLAWNAILLTQRVRPVHGRTYVLSGEATVTGELQSWGVTTLSDLPRPTYTKRTKHSEAFREAGNQWRNADENWLERWRKTTAVLSCAKEDAPLPLLLHVALEAFVNAMLQKRIDFRVPTFVRAAEGVLAVPRHGGQCEFARRAIRIARSLADHYYVGGQDIQARFEQLYKHRNECVHGKLPFPNAYEEGTQNVGQDAAVRVEYLAEALAREAILAALRDPAKLIEFESRDRLEDAWAKGRFP